MKTDQLNEWIENPTTIAILGLIKKELELIQGTPVTDCYVPGSPEKSQENLIELETRQRVYRDFVAIFEGDLEYLEENTNEE